MLIDDMWLDAASDGSGSIIRMAVKPEELGGLDISKGQTFSVQVWGADGPIGRAEVRFLAFIRWRAILEVVALHSADSECPPQRPSVSAFSGSQLERT